MSGKRIRVEREREWFCGFGRSRDVRDLTRLGLCLRWELGTHLWGSGSRADIKCALAVHIHMFDVSERGLQVIRLCDSY